MNTVEKKLALHHRLRHSENLGVIGHNLSACMKDIFGGFVDKKYVLAINAETSFATTEDIMRWCSNESMKNFRMPSVKGVGIQVDYNTWYDLLIYLMTNTRFIQPEVWSSKPYHTPINHWEFVYRNAFSKWHCAVPNVDVINELNFPEVA